MKNFEEFKNLLLITGAGIFILYVIWLRAHEHKKRNDKIYHDAASQLRNLNKTEDR